MLRSCLLVSVTIAFSSLALAQAQPKESGQALVAHASDPDTYSVLAAGGIIVPPRLYANATGAAEADTLCYTIRSYVVQRDEKNSDSTHPLRYSTCQPARRYGVKKAQTQPESAEDSKP